MAVLQDMQWQCKAIETILEHYAEIFVDAEDESGEDPAAAGGQAAPAAAPIPIDGQPYQQPHATGPEDASESTTGYLSSSMDGPSGGERLQAQSYETASNLSISPGSAAPH